MQLPEVSRVTDGSRTRDDLQVSLTGLTKPCTLHRRSVFADIPPSSHIFCLDCAQSLGLAAANGIKICPACETELPNQDDAAITCLNPSEDYKTSVLSGLSPALIMECAGRALAFYSYQTTQEMLV